MDVTPEMSPESSPGVAPNSPGVRRVNNMPVYIAGAALTLFLIIMALVAADRAKTQNMPAAAKEEKAAPTSMFANSLVGKEKDGMVPAAPPPPVPVPPDAKPPLPTAPDSSFSHPPPPPPGDPRYEDSSVDPHVKIRQMKLSQLEEAIRSSTNVKAGAPRSPGSASQKRDPSGPISREDAVNQIAALQQEIEAASPADVDSSYQAKMKLLKAAFDGNQRTQDPSQDAGQTAQPTSEGIPKQRGHEYSRFSSNDKADRWFLESSMQAPRTPYELRAGFVLPATLISGINSDLPGQVIGQISQDVFDTATGRWKLVPQGSRLVGQYSSEVAYGQARVLIAWQRLIFPDGKALDIGAMPGADGAGAAGFRDQVNNHYLRLFGSALLMSGVTAGVALSQPDYRYLDRRDARAAMSEALGQQLGHVTAQMIAKNMGIAPTLEIRPGYRFNVVVVKDLTFSKPYQPFDY